MEDAKDILEEIVTGHDFVDSGNEYNNCKYCYAMWPETIDQILWRHSNPGTLPPSYRMMPGKHGDDCIYIRALIILGKIPHN